MTLRQAIVQRANSLNVVRLFLAFLVIFVHVWPITGSGTAPYPIRVVGDMAVPGFFCLSGFLIARSRMHLSLTRFIWHRSLRIFPALWVVLLITGFVAAPLSTVKDGSWAVAETVGYISSNARLDPYPDYIIDGTLNDQTWNGSLWSLSYEFVAYIGAALLLTLPIVRRHARVVVPVVLTLLVPAAWWANGPGDVTTAFYLRSLVLATYFLAGMALYFWADRIPVDWRLAALAVGALILVRVVPSVGVDPLGALSLAYLLLWAAALIPPRWAQVHDISYGVYIYAYPAQVLLWWFVPDLPLAVLLVLAIALTLPLAWASWLLVERPAMRLRNVGRSRSVVDTAPPNEPAARVST